MKFIIDFRGKKEIDKKFEQKGYIQIYIFNFIPLKKIYLENYINPKTKKIKEENNKFSKRILLKKEGRKIILNIIKTIKIKQLDLNIGINVIEPILNAYAIAIINSVISSVIAITNTKIDLNKDNINYATFISSELLNFKIKSIINVSLVKNIINIVKILILFLKGGRKDGNKTSNRIINDYFNDIHRKYGRC